MPIQSAPAGWEKERVTLWKQAQPEARLAGSPLSIILLFIVICVEGSRAETGTKEIAMLKLSLLPEEYLTIGGSTVVQLSRVAGGRAYLSIEADRSVPIVRGELLEREGGTRPACLAPPSGKHFRRCRDRYFFWNDDRERAVRVMKQTLDQLERDGAAEAAQALRTQLDRIIPTFWEDEITP